MPADKNTRALNEQPMPGLKGNTEQVLLVDDNSTNLQLLYATLNGRGYRLLVARNGQQALDIAHKTRPALILLDIMMPGIDGFETCRQLMKDAHTAESRVIFLSALDDSSNKVKGLQMGAVDYIAKPFDADEVIVRVETHLKIHRLETQLAKRNKQLQADNERILATMHEGILGVNANGSISFVNSAAVRMIGWAEADVLHRSLQSLQLVEGLGSMDSHPLYRCLHEGRSYQDQDTEFIRRDGSRFAVEYSCAPVLDDSMVSGAVMVFRDVSQRKQAEVQLKQAYQTLEQTHQELRDAQMRLIQAAKLESVGRLAAGVAHEVKNPLAVIQLGLDFLASMKPDDGPLSETLHDMADAVQRADSVIRGLLDFSRESKLAMQPHDLNDVIDHALHLVDHELTRNNIRLQKHFDDKIGEIALDSNKMQQVFINLFMNAIHAMGKDGILTVKTQSRRLDDADTASPDTMGCATGQTVAQVEVLDTGCGIADESMIFDPFYTTKPTGQGTGLGLSVTRKIIDLHKGTIDICNRTEGGAAVKITLKTD